MNLKYLEKRLSDHIPAFSDFFDNAKKEYGEPTSEYWYFSYVLKPYIESLLKNNNVDELKKTGKFIESLAGEKSSSLRNELFVMIEELECWCWKLYNYLGKKLKKQWFNAITWFPEKKDKNTRINIHVDKNKYRKRWLEEIKAIGGFENLTDEKQLAIRYKLKHEFGIEGLLASKPGL